MSAGFATGYLPLATGRIFWDLGFGERISAVYPTPKTQDPRPKTQDPIFQGGHIYFVTNRDAYLAAKNIVCNTAPELMENISEAVEQYGYKSQDELLDEAYEELEGIDFNELIVEDNLPENVKVDVSEDENEDFELASNPFLIDQLSKLSEVLNSIELDEETKKQLFDVG